MSDERLKHTYKGPKFNPGTGVTAFSSIKAQGDLNKKINFSVVPGGLDYGVSRFAVVKLTGTFTAYSFLNKFDIEDLDGQTFEFYSYLRKAATMGIRSMPLSAITSSANVTINGKSLRYNDINKYRLAAQYLGQNKDNSITPMAPDIMSRYENIYLSRSIADSQSSADQTIFTYSGSQFYNDKSYLPRSGLDCVRIEYVDGTNPHIKSSYEFEIFECVPCPPFTSDKFNSECLFGVRNMEVELTFSNITKAFCAADCVNQIDIRNCLIKSAELQISIITPKVNEIPQDGRYLRYYPTPEINVYTAVCPIDNIKINCGILPSVPSRIIIYVNPTETWKSAVNEYESDLTLPVTGGGARLGLIYSEPSKANVLFPILSANITFGNTSGILSDCPREGLYEISADSGLTASFNTFKGSAALSALSFADRDEFDEIQSTAIDNPSPRSYLNAAPLFIDVAKYLPVPNNMSVNQDIGVNFSASIEIERYDDVPANMRSIKMSSALMEDGTCNFAPLFPSIDFPEVEICAIIEYERKLKIEYSPTSINTQIEPVNV